MRQQGRLIHKGEFMEKCIYEGKIAEIHTEVMNLKESFNQFKTNDFHELKENVNCIVQKMSRQRLPLWASWLLVGCSALITGLIIAMVK